MFDDETTDTQDAALDLSKRLYVHMSAQEIHHFLVEWGPVVSSCLLHLKKLQQPCQKYVSNKNFALPAYFCTGLSVSIIGIT